ncbi:MAG: N-acetylmuramoyl-L-alanine amidase [Deltaproteobacteria bacterium]|nr:N-acetylmuramoyl-L-alanine amidase [Deltaproteobacteria bacterium]
MRKINRIIVHCSASSFGNAALIDSWHKQNGWDQIGYHYVITNGLLESKSKYNLKNDGLIETGRPVDIIGAHCKGKNRDSIGICLIGNTYFTSKQLLDSLPRLLRKIINKCGLKPIDIYGHRDFSEKPCPNIETEFLRQLIKIERV